MKLTALIFAFALCGLAEAQLNTEVYLFDLKNENGRFSISNPINISNNDGYDNQPSFWPDGKSILYSRTVGGQTEIARYFIKSGKTKIITNTKQGSEYSPTPMPDGKRISSIRLDTTGLQLLYAYDLKGIEAVLVQDLVIGYHAWINNGEIVSFVLGEPATMQIVNALTNESRIVAENIGRSLHKIPDSERFSFVDKSGDQWLIKSMDPKTEETEVLIPVLEQSEDYTWISPNQLLTGTNGYLYLGKIGGDWEKTISLSAIGLTKITRVAVSPDGKKLVVVGE